jgi:hypothetical protein
MRKLMMLALLVGLMLGAMAQAPRHIILIGWDGAQRNHVNECLQRAELPNLAALSAAGTKVDIDITEVTDTKAGWSQILTGYKAAVTGVYSNSKYQPIPKGYSIFERLEAADGAKQIATLAVIGKKGNIDADGPVRIPYASMEKRQQSNPQHAKKAGKSGTVVEENGKKYLALPGKPYFHTKDGMDLFLNGLEKNDAVGAKALEVLEQQKDKPFFFFIHFAEVDHQGHRFGENSKEYNDALISCDTWLGKIREKVKALGLEGDSLIYVTADHGFDEGQKQHKDAPTVFLVTNDKGVVRGGNRMDIAPTIYDRLGIDMTKMLPPLDGTSLLKALPPKPAVAGIFQQSVTAVRQFFMSYPVAATKQISHIVA